MTSESGASMGGGFNIVDPSGMGGNVVVPAAGGSVTAMTPGMRGGALAFGPRSSTALYTARPSFSLGSMEAGMTRMARGMGGRRPFALPAGTRSGGIGVGSGTRRMPGTTGMGVMPPRIGYPFRQPPSLLPPSSTGAGMSM
jgi:hypothetical protein